MGFFSKIKNAFKKTKESLGNKIMSIMSKGELDDEFFDELEEVLISADIGANCSVEIVEQLRERARKDKLRTQEDVKDAMREIMAEILDKNEVPEVSYPLVYLVVGVNGVGKTTTIGKLANFYKSQGKSVLLVAGDTFRAAAVEQLTVWANRNNVKIIKNEDGADPASVVFDGVVSAQAKNVDVVIIDTAGRLHNKKNLMDELAKINRVIGRELPDAARENLLVLDATTGQNAILQAKEFSRAAEITGLVLNKLDGTAKGGIVLSIRKELGLPVKFVGVGEKIDDMQEFDAAEFVEALFSEDEEK